MSDLTNKISNSQKDESTNNMNEDKNLLSNVQEKDYEKIYNHNHKHLIESEKAIEEEIKGILDDELRIKRKLELQSIQQAARFLGIENEKEKNDFYNNNTKLTQDTTLSSLSTIIITMLKKKQCSSEHIFIFLKRNIEQLSERINSERLKELLPIVNEYLQTKERKEDNISKKKKKQKERKPNVNLEDNIYEYDENEYNI